MKKFESLLRQHNLRITRPRQMVFSTLQKADKPLSLNEIEKRCSDIDRSSIYRTIDVCSAIGVIRIVHIGWKKRYELTDLFNSHHHHFCCIKCNRLTHVSDNELESAIEAVSQKYQFSLTAHHFEIEGICRTCNISNPQ